MGFATSPNPSGSFNSIGQVWFRPVGVVCRELDRIQSPHPLGINGGHPCPFASPAPSPARWWPSRSCWPLLFWARPPPPAVANGTPAPLGQYPFAVRLAMTHIPRSDGTFYDSACSAALISPTWIITAGHCFHDINRVPVSGPVPYATTATLNTAAARPACAPRSLVRPSRPAIPCTGRDHRRHRRAAGRPRTDIALARLSAPVTDVTPLGLSDTGPAAGAVLTIAGWGATTSFLPTPRTRLSIGQVKIQTVNPTTITVVGSYPAADTSACLYDSGAPYFTTPPGARTAARVHRKHRPGLPAHQRGNHRTSRHHHHLDQDHRARPAMNQPPDNPAMTRHRTLHGCVDGSAALRPIRVGAPRATASTAGRIRLHRERTSRPVPTAAGSEPMTRSSTSMSRSSRPETAGAVRSPATRRLPQATGQRRRRFPALHARASPGHGAPELHRQFTILVPSTMAQGRPGRRRPCGVSSTSTRSLPARQGFFAIRSLRKAFKPRTTGRPRLPSLGGDCHV